MFCKRDAGFLEALGLYRLRENGGANRRKESPGTAAVTPIDVFVQKERYFAIASADRWNR
jgi:hypothetical protein